MRVPTLLLACLLLAGCTAAVEEPALSSAGAPPALATAPTTVIDVDGASLGSFELDVLCAGGGGVVLPRADDASILPGVTKLVGTFSMTTGTAWQLGYALDDGDVAWIAPLGPGTHTFEIPVAPTQTEEEGARWTFWHQANLPGPAAQECYTGIIVNGWSLTLETALD